MKSDEQWMIGIVVTFRPSSCQSMQRHVPSASEPDEDVAPSVIEPCPERWRCAKDEVQMTMRKGGHTTN